MEVSGHFHGSDALLPVPTGQNAGWPPESGGGEEKELSASTRNWTSIARPVVSSLYWLS
jgi:hypothetical protein